MFYAKAVMRVTDAQSYFFQIAVDQNDIMCSAFKHFNNNC